MNITYIANIRFPSERAHAYQIAKNCEAFVLQGHGVRVLSRWEFKVPASPQGFFKLKVPIAVTRIPCVDVLSLFRGPLLKKIAFLILRSTFHFSLFFYLPFLDQETIYYTRDPYILKLLTFFRRNVVLELHDLSEWQEREIGKHENKLLAVVCISEGLKEELLKTVGVPEEKVLTAHDAVDLEEFQHEADRFKTRRSLGIGERELLIVYAGSFYPWKGVDLFLEEWSSVSPDFHLLLVGGPAPEFERISAKIQNLSLGRVTLVPSVSRERVVAYLSCADLGLLPTSPYFDIGNKYTSPLKLFEYLAAGLPVLASDVPSSREVLNDKIALFYSYKDKNLVRVLEGVLRERSWLERASALAKRQALTYSWEHRAKRILDFIADRV